MRRFSLSFVLLVAVCAGCSESTSQTSNGAAVNESVTSEPATEVEQPATDPSVATSDPVSAPLAFAPISTSDARTASSTSESAALPATVEAERRISLVMEHLKPLQVMLGKWRGTTRRDYDGFKAVDNHEWIWDLQTDPSQPALKVDSDKSPYLTAARLTWNVETAQFQLQATDKSGITRNFMGDYTDPVHEIIGPDDKLHRVFRLEVTQTEDALNKDSDGGERWQVAFAQQENNRYLLEVSKRRGAAAFRRFDTVSTQRDGTSFALSDSDYGEKTCIISQGLGTTPVSYQGKTYWVCCSGCKAAFEEDPATWIARAQKRAAEK